MRSVTLFLLGAAIAAALPKTEELEIAARIAQARDAEQLAQDLDHDIDSGLDNLDAALAQESSACTSDQDCPGQGKPNFGSMKPAFCVEGSCSLWKSGKPFGPEGYPFWPDGKNKVMVPRKVLPYTPAEIYYSFPVDQPNGEKIRISEDGTKAIFPMYKVVQAGFSRTYSSLGTSQSGLVNMHMQANTMSILTSKSAFVMAEKSHVMNHDGPWSVNDANKAMHSRKSRWWITQKTITAARYARTKLVGISTGLSGVSDRLIEAAQDRPEIAKTEAFVAAGGSKIGVSARVKGKRWMAHMWKARNKGFEAAKKVPSKGTETSCVHISADPELSMTETELTIPLNKNLGAVRGQMTPAPERYFSVFSGFSMATYNEKTKSIEVALIMPQHFVMNDFRSHPKPTGALYIGPPNGYKAAVSPTDGRTDFYDFPKTAGFVFATALAAFPIDYTMYLEPADKLCPQSKVNSLTPYVKTALDGLYVSPGVSKYTGQAFMGSIMQQGSLFLASTSSAPCAANFIKSDIPGVMSFDVLEFMAWGHGIIETPVNHVASLMQRYFDIGPGGVGSIIMPPDSYAGIVIGDEDAFVKEAQSDSDVAETERSVFNEIKSIKEKLRYESRAGGPSDYHQDPDVPEDMKEAIDQFLTEDDEEVAEEIMQEEAKEEQHARDDE